MIGSRLAATDGHRAAIFDDVEIPLAIDSALVLPLRYVHGMGAEYSYDEDRFYVRSDGVCVSSPWVTARFPAIDSVIPSTDLKGSLQDLDNLRGALECCPGDFVTIVCGDRMPCPTLRVDLEDSWYAIGPTIPDVRIVGEVRTFSVNFRYLISAIETFENPRIDFYHPRQPLVVTDGDGDGLVVIMPARS